MAKILIIDDEVQLRKLLARIIGLEGYEVLEAGDCASGLKMLRQHEPDVILCDVKLPDGSGVELAAKIKGQVVTAKVKGGASGKLYGKVTGKEVAELLTALTGTEIDKKKVELPSAIKEFGSYDASVRLYAGVVAPFKLKVEEL